MKGKFLWTISLGIALISLPACFSHSGSSAGPDANASNLTVGKVQGRNQGRHARLRCSGYSGITQHCDHR